MATSTKKPTAKQIVAAHLETLRGLSHGELFTFSREHGINSDSGFAAFKRALLAEGIDYEALRTAGRAAQQQEREAACTHSLTLYTDAKAREDRFAICDADGQPVWFGRFFADDRDYNGEQSSGEMADAKKAVWLASKVAQAVGAKSIRLNLIVDAEWLTWANAANDPSADRKRGGKALALADAARRCNVVLEVTHIAGADNPADQYTVCSGFRRWQDSDLALLTDDRAADRRAAREAARRESDERIERERREHQQRAAELAAQQSAEEEQRKQAGEQQEAQAREEWEQKLTAARNMLGEQHDLIVKADALAEAIANADTRNRRKALKWERKETIRQALVASGMNEEEQVDA